MNKNEVIYHYYNCNPLRRLTDDCVIRAICSSTGESWEKVLRDLTEYCVKTGYMLNTPECYGVYLKDIGYVKQKQPISKDGKKMRFKEFVHKFNGHAIAHCGKGHITYVADNATWDIWDVSDEVVGKYWVHQAELEFVKKVGE
jgi:hypothetical protein